MAVECTQILSFYGLAEQSASDRGQGHRPLRPVQPDYFAYYYHRFWGGRNSKHNAKRA